MNLKELKNKLAKKTPFKVNFVDDEFYLKPLSQSEVVCINTAFLKHDQVIEDSGITESTVTDVDVEEKLSPEMLDSILYITNSCKHIVVNKVVDFDNNPIVTKEEYENLPVSYALNIIQQLFEAYQNHLEESEKN